MLFTYEYQNADKAQINPLKTQQEVSICGTAHGAHWHRHHSTKDHATGPFTTLHTHAHKHTRFFVSIFCKKKQWWRLPHAPQITDGTTVTMERRVLKREIWEGGRGVWWERDDGRDWEMEEGRRDALQPAWKTTVVFLHPGSSWRLRNSPLAVSFTWKFERESLGDHNMTFGVQMEENPPQNIEREKKKRNFSTE